ncbi:MAG: hypothetical protein AAF598_10775 [Bacteroidota bacterium]
MGFRWKILPLLGILILGLGKLNAQTVDNISTNTACIGGTITFDVLDFSSGSFSVEFQASGNTTVTSTAIFDNDQNFNITVPSGAESGAINLIYDDLATDPDTFPNVAFITIFDAASITGLEALTYCDDETAITIVGTPLGGSFAADANDGASVTNGAVAGVGTFDPSATTILSSPDTIEISYTFADNRCPSTDVDIIVTEDFTVTAPNDQSYTTAEGSVTLSGLSGANPSGGTFSLNDTTITTFNPSSRGVGTYTLVYEVTDGPCVNSDNFTITVTDATPVVTGFDPASTCAGQSLTIEGQNFSGVATVTFQTSSGTTTLSSLASEIMVSATELVLTVPSDAVSGAISISVNGTTFDGFSISVDENPPVINNLTASQVFCFDDPSVTLSASPAGGTFTGNGIFNGVFTPSTVGNVGDTTINITYTVSSACGNNQTATVSVSVIQDLLSSVSTNTPVSSTADSVDLFQIVNIFPASSATDGFFSGPGVTNNVFDPSSQNTGSTTLTYTFVDVNSGCSASEDFTIDINQGSNIEGVLLEYCNNDGDVIFGRDLDQFPFPGFDFMDIATNGFGFGSGIFEQTNFNGGEEEFIIRIDQAPPGVYEIGVRYSGNSGLVVLNALITIDPAPSTPTFTLPKTEFCPEESETIFTGDIAGGIFRIGSDTIVNGIFSPSNFASGTYGVTYTLSNGSCSTVSDTTQISIFNTNPANFVGLDAEYCSNESSIQLLTDIGGGTFSGDGVVAGADLFSPSLLGLGIGSATINYSYVDNNSCTVTSTSVVSLIDPDLTISFSGLPTEACINDDPITMTPSVSGGTFSVLNPDGGALGISGNDFDPAIAGAGLHTVTYSLVNSNPVCVSTVSESITINDLPAVNFPSIDNQVCVTETSITFSGSPQGGTYIIRNSNNVLVLSTSSAIIDPSTLGVDTYTVTYTVADATTGCTSTSTAQTFEVTDPPIISFSGPEADNQYCSDDGIQTLTGSPDGGTFSGDGIISSTGLFDPSAVTGGTTLITYTFSENGCDSEATVTYTVDGPPSLFIGGVNDGDEFCIGGGNIALTGLPAGGTFSILNPDNGSIGIENDTLKPSIAGTGTHEITYFFTDPSTSCSNSLTVSVNVLALPTPSFSGLDGQYCDDAENVALVGTPSPDGDDIFSILNPDGGSLGIVGSEFRPSEAGVGIHTITYTFTDDNGCVNSFSQDVEVLAQPVVEFDDAANQYVFCFDDPTFTFTATPPGGTYTGPGIVFGTTDFDPSVAGAGTFDIVYSFTDGKY